MTIRIVSLFLTCSLFCLAQRKPLSKTDMEVIANLLLLEDSRRFDAKGLEHALRSAHPEIRRRAAISIGRIADPRGKAMLASARSEPNVEVQAAIAFSAGQLKDEAAISWLAETMSSPQSPVKVAQQAARSLGKIQTKASAEALASYLQNTAMLRARAEVIGEAILSFGRHTGVESMAPVLRWLDTNIVDLQWRVPRAFRNRTAAEDVPVLLKLSRHTNPEVRFWAVRRLLAPAGAATRLIEAMEDPDRRVRAEATRALGTYGDDASFSRLVKAMFSADTWMAIFAVEAMAGFTKHADVLIPKLIEASHASRPMSVQLSILPVLTRLAPVAGKQLQARLPLVPERPKIDQLPARSIEDCRRIVAKWVVPDYEGKPKPRAIWETDRGPIEIELYSGDAPLAVDYFATVSARGDIDGTVFGRVVPNFVAQQRPIRNVSMIRDEVNLHPLTRGNLSWASRGLDTGPPGYTLGLTPQPHNEGNFTALGRVTKGMDVVDRLELGDSVIRMRMR